MPGPLSAEMNPTAIRNGVVYRGKTAIKRAGLKSGDGTSWERPVIEPGKQALKKKAAKTRVARAGSSKR